MLPDRDQYIFTLLTLVYFIVIYFKGLNSNLDISMKCYLQFHYLFLYTKF